MMNTLSGRDVDDPQEPARASATDRHPRALAPRPVFTGLPENLLDFVFRDAVRVDVWHPRRRIEVEANFHVADATTESGTECVVWSGMPSTHEL